LGEQAAQLLHVWVTRQLKLLHVWVIQQPAVLRIGWSSAVPSTAGNQPTSRRSCLSQASTGVGIIARPCTIPQSPSPLHSSPLRP